jgi:hypothetical protein
MNLNNETEPYLLHCPQVLVEKNLVHQPSVFRRDSIIWNVPNLRLISATHYHPQTRHGRRTVV